MRPLPLTLLLAACADDATKDDTGVAAETTWYEDVAPLVEQSCASCHSAGGVAGLDLTDPATAAANAELMAGMVNAGLMPPPAADPSCRPYAGADAMNIDEDERAVFEAWAEAGAPLGDPADAPAPADEALRLTDPDLRLTMPFAYTPELDGDGNEYWCVELENTLEQTVWITGLDVELGNSAVVHHMLLMKDTENDAGEDYGDVNPAEGFVCRDPMMEDDWMILHAWAPGMGATLLPEGAGMELAPGDQIILQMHYFWEGDGAPEPDQSAYVLETTTEVPEDQIEVVPVGPAGFTIPAGEADYEVYDELTNRWGVDIKIHGVFPHQHLLGTRYESWIEEADGGTTCLARGDWDFHHQAFYMYEETAYFSNGDTLAGTCSWDNSADNPDQYNDPPEDVTWGEGTNQEMCYFLFYLSY